MGTGSMRGAAAIVGVADAASPTGELETRGRVLEAAMIREALDDAGLSLADVDGVCCSGMATGIAEYLGIHPRFVDGTFVGGSSFEVHVEHAVGRDRRRPVRGRGRCVRVDAPAGPPTGPDRAGARADGTRRRRRVGGPLRPADADDLVRAGGEPAHGAVRHDVGAARPASRSTPGAGRPTTRGPGTVTRSPSTTCSRRR